ncbi:MAG: hypothetical protein JO112_20535 [Planctomycetes bacterium]|nr:hypothetical protein [Planctomycetota bacterium]
MSETFKIWYVPRWWPDPERSPERGFTEAAIKVLDDVEGLANTRKISGAVPPVVVLWCVLRRWNQSGRLGLVVLEACGVSRESLEHDIEEELRPRFGSSGLGVDLGTIHQVVLKAHEEAATLGHNWVGTEHLVLALLTSEDTVLGKLFQKYGVSRERFKPKLAEILHT